MNELRGVIVKRLKIAGRTRVYELHYTGKLVAENKVQFTKCIGHSYTLLACESELPIERAA